VHRTAQNALLHAYRLVFARGLLRLAWGRRLFFAAYELYKRLFEARNIAALRAYVPEGGIVIDVGANVGFFTERFAQWVGAAGRVIAIEPERTNFAELMRRLEARQLAERVEARRAVADARSGTARLVINPDHPGDHRIGETGEPVAALVLDELAPAGRPVALIKIDVQGAEMRVLAGAGALLARDKPALFVEIDPGGLARFGGSVEARLDARARLGYAPHFLAREGARACTRADLDAVLAQRGYTDLLFLGGPVWANIDR
jgi:FkbM family methyltransferase